MTDPGLGAIVLDPSFSPDGPTDLRVIRRFVIFSRMTAIVAIVVGALVLGSWVLDLPIHKSVWGAMKANAALGFMFAGVALLLSHTSGMQRQPNTAWIRAGQLCAFFVLLIGSLTLSEYLFGWDLGLDQLLVKAETPMPGIPPPGRMALSAAVNFVLLGAALLLLRHEWPRSHHPAEYLALPAAVIGLLAIVGYGYDVPALYRMGHYSSMPLLTALTFTLFSAAVVTACPDRGMMALFTRDTAGSVLARRLVPGVIGIPLLLGWLRLEGERAGYFDAAFGTLLLVGAVIAVITAVVSSTVEILDRADFDRRQAAATLRKWAHLFEHAGWGVAIGSPNGQNFELVNPAYAQMHGYTVEELIGRPTASVYPADLRDKVPDYVDEIGRKDHYVFESRHARKDGTTFPALVDATAVKDETGRILYHAVNVQDISALKRAEELLAQANKELEAFSYSVAHDLRAPLRAINGFSKILLKDHAQQMDEEAREFLGRVSDAAKHMGQLIDDLLSLSRISRAEMSREKVDLSSIARTITARLQQAWSERQVECAIQDGLVAEGDGRLLTIVLENLLGNAWKYTSKRADARVEFGQIQESGRPAYFVRDNGAGFDMAYAANLFGAFQRLHTSDEFEGTGIGLATVQRIVHRHGGRVWGEGKVDGGATFYFTL